MKKVATLAFLALLAVVPAAWGQATLASLKGTYTFQGAELNNYYIAYSLNGQQVGFCNGALSIVGYSCFSSYSYVMLQGSLVSDGAGHITSGSYTSSGDPNSYECNPSNKPTKPCPVVVPSDNPYSATESYAVGATVDFTVGSVTKTFQAVRASKGKPPDWASNADLPFICSNSATYSNLSTCLWTHIPGSLTVGTAFTANFTGKYTIGANGSGVLTIVPENCTECSTVQMTFIASPASQVGQSVSLLGIPTLTNYFDFMGAAVRIK